MSIKPRQLSRAPLPDRIADMIKQEIAEGRLAPGERLPPEQVLAENFGVSRNVVREGIARLRNEGIIESRQGIGAFVATSPTPTLRLDASLRSPDRHQSLFELRAALEVRAAELAALRRTEEDLQAIQRAFDDMERSMDWGKDGVEHDIEFHRAIAGATGNGFMLATIMFIAEHLKESIKLTRTMSDIKEVNAVTLQEHRAILVAIGARDPAAAKLAMATHLTNAATRIGIQSPA
ncbi:FadR/GntR family transcriptional regulator [Taklimakanibacter albus]|jgi:GntR family transcriptional repressor for pyruvate dehydrogenase complex|uniref:FadR family transcriptional regulator n=1 Tax=Taklimakanibacter albus TaxID=2800327 RepID=A0ACC5R6Y9_9HYPH|nr:FadR/GntR family transcriptional regulator [Aestuariivirga sp. YIM B02566]MBK1868441.1 FadR family transcriptional regulator [Aestuariivirga sp. YIM B02566]